MAPAERHIEEALYRSAVELIERRYPTGWGGAAAMRLAGKDNGKHDGSNGSEALIVTSVAIETPNAAASLCIEVGAMCEAMKLDRRVTHTICVVRDDEHAPFTVLSPCGICQERLRYWGDDVMCAVSDNNQESIRCSCRCATCSRTIDSGVSTRRIGTLRAISRPRLKSLLPKLCSRLRPQVTVVQFSGLRL